VRCVEGDPALVDEQHAAAALERQRRPLLGDEHRRAELAGDVEDLDRSFRIELRGRLVQDEQLRLEREHRGEADALELAGRQGLRSALGETGGADLGERGVHPRPDLIRRGPDVLEAERDLVGNMPEDDLVLGILEEHGDCTREVGGPETPCVHARDDDATLEPPAVEMRDEAGKCAQERRLPGARRSEHGHDLARLERE
jgi:hypothetical protein